MVNRKKIGKGKKYKSLYFLGRTFVLPIFLQKKCSWEGDRRIWGGSPVFVWGLR